MEARVLGNPYQGYSPAELLREWTTLQGGVDRNVNAVAEALKKRIPGDPPVGLSHVITALTKSQAAMILIESVVEQILKETRSYKICGFDTKMDKGTIFTYAAVGLDTAFSIATAAVLIYNSKQTSQQTNPWIPFGMNVGNTVLSIAKDYGWRGLVEYQKDVFKLARVVNKDALGYLQGIITSFQGMERVNRRIEADRSASETELEKDLRTVGAFPSSQQFPVDLFMNQITSVKRAEPGTRLHAVAQVIIEKNRKARNQEMEEEPVIVRENWKETIKRRKKEEKRLRYEREESESERRGRLMESFVEPTCSDWIVDTEAASDKALEIRSNINAAIDAIDTDTSQEIQRDFSALIELLKSSKRELNDELLYVLDTFLHEESKWEESACFKWTARCRSGIHYLSHLVALVVLGVDGYRQNNSEEASNNLTIVATVIIVASLVLGKWNDRMYKSLLDKRIRRGELERIQRYVEVTIKRCDALIPFYENLQELRQQERALTSPEVANAIEKVNDLPHKYRGPAARCVKTVIKEHPIPTEEHSDEETPLGSRIRKLQEEERAIKAKQQVEFDIVAEESKKSVGGRKVNALSPIGIYEGKEAKKEDRKRSTVFLDSDTESQDDLDAWRFNVERQQSIEKRERKESDLSHASKNLRASAELARHISEV